MAKTKNQVLEEKLRAQLGLKYSAASKLLKEARQNLEIGADEELNEEQEEELLDEAIIIYEDDLTPEEQEGMKHGAPSPMISTSSSVAPLVNEAGMVESDGGGVGSNGVGGGEGTTSRRSGAVGVGVGGVWTGGGAGLSAAGSNGENRPEPEWQRKARLAAERREKEWAEEQERKQQEQQEAANSTNPPATGPPRPVASPQSAEPHEAPLGAATSAEEGYVDPDMQPVVTRVVRRKVTKGSARSNKKPGEVSTCFCVIL